MPRAQQPKEQDSQLSEEKLNEFLPLPEDPGSRPGPPPVETLYSALAQVQARLPKVAKSKTARVKTKTGIEYSYKYADLPDINDAVLPLLSSVGLVLVFMPRAKDVSGALRTVLEYRLVHAPTGEALEGEVLLPDRADPQEAGSHITYYRRYIVCCLTGLAADEDEDGQMAKGSAASQERATAASRAEIPGTQVDGILSVLDARAKATLADLVQAWKVIVRHEAARRPSGVVLEPVGGQDATQLSWYATFVQSLAERVETLATADEARAFYLEAKSLQGGKDLPMITEGLLGAVAERGKTLAAAEAEVREAAEAESARKAIEDAAEDTQAGLEPAFESPAYLNLYRGIWRGDDGVLRTQEWIDARWEAGDIDGDEQVSLRLMVEGRPAVATSESTAEVLYDWLRWQAMTAPTRDHVEQVFMLVQKNGLGKYGGQMDARQAQGVYAAMSARRFELEPQAKGGAQ